MDFRYINQYVKFIFAVFFFLVSAFIGWSLSQAQGAATVIWPAAGVGVLSWLIWRKIGLAGTFVGAIVFFQSIQLLDSDNDFIGKMSLLGIILAALATTLQSWLTGVLVEQKIGFPIEFPRLSTGLKLVIISGITSLITPTIVLFYINYPQINLAIIQQWYWWWAGCMIGVVLVLPLGFYVVKNAPDWLPSFKTVVSPMVIIWGFTFILYGIVLQVQGRSNGTLFTEQSRSIASILSNTLNSYEDALRAYDRFITSDPDFLPEDFQQFGVPMVRNIPGLEGFALIKPINSDRSGEMLAQQLRRHNSTAAQDWNVDGTIVRQANYIVTDNTENSNMSLGMVINSAEDRPGFNAIEQAVFKKGFSIQSSQKDKKIDLQFYSPVFNEVNGELTSVISANVQAGPVLEKIFSVQDSIPKQTILIHKKADGHSQVIFATETLNSVNTTLEQLKINWRGVFARHELVVGTDTWELFQFTAKPIVYDQFLLSSVIAGGFMFSGILCWFVLVLAGNAKSISLQVEKQTLELQISSELMEASQHIAKLGSWEWFPDQDKNHWSNTLYDILGLMRTEQPSLALFLGLVHSEDKRNTKELISNWRTGKSMDVKYQCRLRVPGRKQSTHIHLYCDWIKHADGSPNFLSVVMQDVTELMESQKQLLLAAATFESQDAILIADAKGKVQRINRAYSVLFGVEFDEISKGEKGFSFLYTSEQNLESILTTVAETGSWNGELMSRTFSGYLFPSFVSISAVESTESKIINYVVNIKDVSDQKEAQDKIKQLAYFDSLTGLPNRESFYLSASSSLYEFTKNNQFGALLFLDLDNFKVLNDTLGHKMGDALINEVAKRFKLVLDNEDVLARFGGDEFLLLLSRGASCHEDIRKAASSCAERLLSSMESPFWIGGHSYKISASIGIAIIEQNNMDTESLVVQADLAMYFAKLEGRNRYRYYESKMGQTAQDKFKIENKIRTALAEKSFEVFYQPQVNHLNEIVGMESLVRWHDREMGVISPDKFIPLAEESALIVDIESYIFETVCMDLKNWESINKKLVPIAINVSPVHLIQSGFMSHIEDLIERYQVSPELLCIEITERVLAEDTGLMKEQIQNLKNKGMKVSIDDFGTGYSSLSYLKQLPINEIKIAREFIQDIPHDVKDVALVRTISNLADNLNLTVIAEGIETAEQFEFLVAEGCRKFQGYYLHKPMPKKDVTKILPNAALMSELA